MWCKYIKTVSFGVRERNHSSYEILRIIVNFLSNMDFEMDKRLQQVEMKWKDTQKVDENAPVMSLKHYYYSGRGQSLLGEVYIV